MINYIMSTMHEKVDNGRFFSISLSASILCFYLCSILKGYPNIVFGIHGDEVDQAAPQLFIKLCYEILSLEFRDETVHLPAAHLAFLDFLTSLVVLSLICLIPIDQCVVFLAVFILILDRPGILRNQLLHLLCQQIQLYNQFAPHLFQSGCITKRSFQQANITDHLFLVSDELIHSPYKSAFDLIFCQTRRLAVILEFIIATIDCPTVLVIGVPHFGSVPPAARSTLDFAGENGYAAIAFLPFPAPLDFFLHPVEYLRADDSFVVVFHIVLRHFPPIILGFLRQEIDGEPLLQQGIALIFLIGQDTLHRFWVPFALARRGLQPARSQLACDGVERITVQKKAVYQFYRFGLLLVNYQIAIRPFVIAQEMPVGNTHLPISESFPMTLGHVLGDAPAFFLREAAHDSDKEFALGIQCPDVFLLEINLDAFVFQLSYCSQAVNCVSDKAAD